MKKVLIFMLSAVMSITLTSCQTSRDLSLRANTVGTYNTSPNIAGKFIGSSFMLSDGDPAKSIDQLVGWADLIIIGTVTSNGIGFEETMIDTSAVKNFLVTPPKVSLTEYQVRVERVIYGNEDRNSIKLVQVGNPDSDMFETKVRKGEQFLMFLWGDPAEYYCSAAQEDGYFLIREDNTVLSYSDSPPIAKYDGTEVSLLYSDVLHAIERVKK